MPGDKKVEVLDLQGLPSGGDSWIRTNDPIDVNDVLCRAGMFFKLKAQGIRCREAWKIGISNSIPFRSWVHVRVHDRGTRAANVVNKGFL